MNYYHVLCINIISLSSYIYMYIGRPFPTVKSNNSSSFPFEKSTLSFLIARDAADEVSGCFMNRTFISVPYLFEAPGESPGEAPGFSIDEAVPGLSSGQAGHDWMSGTTSQWRITPKAVARQSPTVRSPSGNTMDSWSLFS